MDFLFRLWDFRLKYTQVGVYASLSFDFRFDLRRNSGEHC